ncbi:MAG: DUF3794 domain-containing protein [Lachnospiraceae bacterium]|nr:DUF3794 domain-containing protein [Lachnospiraceae bacterium]
MEIKLQSIHMNRVKCRNALRLTVDDDVNVPDNKPDVRTVIWETGTVRLNEKKLSGGRLYLKGTLAYHMLYLSEEKAEPVQSVRGELPFDESIEMPEACVGDAISVRAEVEELEIGMIHSRKFAVRALLGIMVQAEELHDVRAAVEMEEAPAVHTKTRVIPVTSIVVDKKDTARLREEIFLPSGKDGIANLLFWELELCNAEARAREGVLEAKGELSMFLLWQSDREEGELECYEAMLPFKTEFEISGCREGLIDDVVFRITNENVSVKADEDGEDRLLEAEAVLEAEMKLYEESEMELLSDLYATNCSLKPVYQTEEYENLLLKNDSRLRLAERLPLAEGMPGILQICRGSAEIKPDVCTREGENLKLSGVLDVRLLYISEEDDRPLQSYRTEIPFTHQIEIRGLTPESSYDIRCNVAEAVFGMVRNGEAEMKAELAFSVLAMENRKEEVIVDTEREEFDENRLEELPSMIGYTVKAGESLWDIAKRYYATQEEIIKLTEHSGEVREGDLLLVVKAVGN